MTYEHTRKLENILHSRGRYEDRIAGIKEFIKNYTSSSQNLLTLSSIVTNLEVLKESYSFKRAARNNTRNLSYDRIDSIIRSISEKHKYTNDMFSSREIIDISLGKNNRKIVDRLKDIDSMIRPDYVYSWKDLSQINYVLEKTHRKWKGKLLDEDFRNVYENIKLKAEFIGKRLTESDNDATHLEIVPVYHSKPKSRWHSFMKTGVTYVASAMFAISSITCNYSKHNTKVKPYTDSARTIMISPLHTYTDPSHEFSNFFKEKNKYQTNTRKTTSLGREITTLRRDYHKHISAISLDKVHAKTNNTEIDTTKTLFKKHITQKAVNAKPCTALTIIPGSSLNNADFVYSKTSTPIMSAVVSSTSAKSQTDNINNDIRISDTNIGLKSEMVVSNIYNEFGIFKQEELLNTQGYIALRDGVAASVHGEKTGLTNRRFGGSIDSKMLDGITNFFKKNNIGFGVSTEYSHDNIEDDMSSSSVIGSDSLTTDSKILQTKNMWLKSGYIRLGKIRLGYALNTLSDSIDVRTFIIYQGYNALNDQLINIDWRSEIYSLDISDMLGFRALKNSIVSEGISEKLNSYIGEFNTHILSDKNHLVAYYYGYGSAKMSEWNMTFMLRRHEDIDILGKDIGVNASLEYMQSPAKIASRPKDMRFTLSSDGFKQSDDYKLDKSIVDSVSFVHTHESIESIVSLFYARDPLIKNNPIIFRARFGQNMHPEYDLGIDLLSITNGALLMFVLYSNHDNGVFDNNPLYRYKNTVSIGLIDDKVYASITTTLNSPKEYKISAGIRF